MKPGTLTVARPLAPEDIQSGIYVAVLHEHESFMPFCYVDSLYELNQVEPVNWRSTPDKAKTMRVVSACVPYVLVENPNEKIETLDLRNVSLAKLSDEFGRESFDRLKPKKKPAEPKAAPTVGSKPSKRSWKRLWRRKKGSG